MSWHFNFFFFSLLTIENFAKFIDEQNELLFVQVVILRKNLFFVLKFRFGATEIERLFLITRQMFIKKVHGRRAGEN